MHLSFARPLSMALVFFLPAGSLSAQTALPPPAKVAVADINASDDALQFVLEKASKDLSGVVLRADKEIGDYRLAVFAKQKTESALRSDLVFLFSHGEARPGFYWVPESQKTDQQLWLLRRTTGSRQREAAMPDAVAAKCRKWLRELYGAATLTGKARERAARIADSGFFGNDKDLTGPVGALAALDQEGLEHLVTEGSATVPQERLLPALIGTRVPGNVGMLTFTPSPDEKGAFVMTVDTSPKHQSRQLGMVMVIDPLNVMGVPGLSPDMLKEKPSDPTIDLTPFFRADSKEKITTLNDWLNRIAKASGASTYCEYFPTNDGRPATHNLAKKERCLHCSTK